MFYPVGSLKRGGRFYLCWVADSCPERFASITHRQLWSQDVRKICDDLLNVIQNESGRPTNRFSLRLCSQLLRGPVRLYEKQVNICLNELCMINANVAKQANKKYNIIVTGEVQRTLRSHQQVTGHLPQVTLPKEPETEQRIEEIIQGGFGEGNPEVALQLMAERCMELMMEFAAQLSMLQLAQDSHDESRLVPDHRQMERVSDRDLTIIDKRQLYDVIAIRLPCEVYKQRPSHAGASFRSYLGAEITILFMRILEVLHRSSRAERNFQEGVMDRLQRPRTRCNLALIDEDITHPETSVTDVNLSKEKVPEVRVHEDISDALTHKTETLSDHTRKRKWTHKHVLTPKQQGSMGYVSFREHQQPTAVETSAAAADKEAVKENVPANMQHVPEAMQQIPEAMQHVREAIQHVPEAMQHVPEAMLHVPEAIQHVPEAMQQVPEAMQHVSEAIQHVPEAMQHVSEAMQHVLEAIQHVPEVVEEVLHAKEPQKSVTTMLKEAGSVEIQIPCEMAPAGTSRENTSKRHESDTSETPLGCLDRTNVSLGDSAQITDSMIFIRDHWGTEGTMIKILKFIRYCPVEAITVKTLLAKGPVLPGYKRIIAATCFTSLLKLKQHGFIVIKKCPVTLEIVDVDLGYRFPEYHNKKGTTIQVPITSFSTAKLLED